MLKPVTINSKKAPQSEGSVSCEKEGSVYAKYPDSLRNAPPGSVAANNGLSVNSGVVQLGGNLNQATQIAMGSNNFELTDNASGNISLGTNPAVYPVTTGGGAGGTNIAIGHQNSFTNQHGIALGDNNSVGYGGIALGSSNTLSNSNFSNAMGTDIKLENTGGSTITTATGIGEGLHNYAGHSILIGQQVALAPNGSGVFIGSHFTTTAVTAMETYISNNPSATYMQIDADAQASNGGLQPNYIPGISVSNANKVGVGILAPQAKLDVYGSINSNGFPVTSDSALKTNIVTMADGAMSKIRSLRPVTFDWINKVDTFMYGTQYGFTAQQVETVLPELVKTTANNQKHLSYMGLMAYMVKAMQEQQAHIKHQDTVIDQLVATVGACCSTNSKFAEENLTGGIPKSTQEIKLTLPISIFISEARPNPNSGKTEIDYYVPSNITEAKVIFTDMMGRTIYETILANGYGSLSVDTRELPNGIYSFTLQADGKMIDTKKMIKQQ